MEKVAAEIAYANRIPLEIVGVFEKYGFVWGGTVVPFRHDAFRIPARNQSDSGIPINRDCTPGRIIVSLP